VAVGAVLKDGELTAVQNFGFVEEEEKEEE